MSETTSIYTCQICKREFKSFNSLGNHIGKTHKIKSKDYYDKFIKIESDGICPECGKETGYRSLNIGYLKYCSYKCSANSEEMKNKKKVTNLEKYGHEYVIQVPEFKEKSKVTMVERHGASNPMQVPKFKEKSISTCLNKYGYEYVTQVPEFKEKSKSTMMRKYNVRHAVQVPEFKNKMKSTLMIKHGVSNAMQVPEISKRCFATQGKLIEYILPSDKIIMVHGSSEYKAVDLLLQSFTEDELIIGTSEVPSIPYFFNKKEHVYHPDIWIPSINTLVEVKSTYTMDKAYDELNYDRNIAKHNFAIEAGFDHAFLII